ncbi:MAG TPA: flavin reductase family protein [Streptosporangiaceae bacterium]|nr:flavin reductase family protein [Streptosporangiaceae bacterium]
MSNDLAALFRRLTLGVYVVGVAHGERRNAFTAAWITQVSFDPLLLALSISPRSASYPLLSESGAFAVTVLKAHQIELARRLGTPAPKGRDKLAGIQWQPGRSGAPIVPDGLAWFECEVTARLPAGDHVLVLGRVVDGRLLDADAAPLIYQSTGDMDGSAALYPTGF